MIFLLGHVQTAACLSTEYRQLISVIGQPQPVRLLESSQQGISVAYTVSRHGRHIISTAATACSLATLTAVSCLNYRVITELEYAIVIEGREM